MASNQALKLQIARVKNTVLNGAMLQFANRPMANKTEAMEVLAEMVINGSITLEMIQPPLRRPSLPLSQSIPHWYRRQAKWPHVPRQWHSMP